MSQNINVDLSTEERIESLEKRVEFLEKKVELLRAEKEKVVIEKTVERTVEKKQPSKPLRQSYTSYIMSGNSGETGANTTTNTTTTTTNTQTSLKKEIKEKVSMESKIGKNLMGILASVLIFISILIFGGMVYSQLGVIAKVVVLLVLSIALGLTGLLKMRRGDSYYVLFSSMAGCGICALYITVILMHFVFDMIPLPVLTIAMFAWTIMVAALSVAKDRMFTYICFAGIVISTLVCAFNWDNAGWSLLYYGISSVVLFVLSRSKDYNKNILFFIQLPIMAMILTGAYYENTIAVVCITLFVVAALVAQNFCYAIENRELAVLIPVTVISLFSVVVSMVHMGFSIGYGLIKYPFTLIFVVIAIIYSIKYVHKNIAAFCVAFYFATVMIAINMFDYLWVYAIIALILGGVFHNAHCKYVAYGYTILGLLLSSEQFITVIFDFGMIPMLVITAIIILIAVVANHLSYSAVDKYVLSGMTAFWIIYAGRQEIFSEIVVYILLSLLSIYMNLNHYHKNRFTGEIEKVSVISGYVVNGIIILRSLELLWSSDLLLRRGDFFEIGHLINTLLIVLVCIAVFVINNRQLFKLEVDEKVVGIYLAVKFTVLIISLLQLLRPASYIVSIVGLLIAIFCIVLGFKVKIKSFRLYGLILTLVCVAKLILFDIEYESILLKPIGFFLAGILCFAISWIYSRLEKKNEEEEQELQEK